MERIVGINNQRIEGVRYNDEAIFRASIEGYKEVTFVDCEFIDCDLFMSKFSHCSFIRCKMASNWDSVKFEECTLVDVDFSEGSISDTRFSSCKLSNVKGLGSKEDEMEFAAKFLREIKAEEYKLDMWVWVLVDKCGTSCCIAGRKCLDMGYTAEEIDSISPRDIASRHIPTLAQYFHVDQEKVLAALERVASGEESIWNQIVESIDELPS